MFRFPEASSKVRDAELRAGASRTRIDLFNTLDQQNTPGVLNARCVTLNILNASTRSFAMHKTMKRKTDNRRRALRFESLEQRALLAADVQKFHNFAMPEDCDANGSVSPLDALVVINELNRPEAVGASDSLRMIDVDADGQLTPLDALVVINFINHNSSDGEESISSVPLEARIARLESAIAEGLLPPAMDIDNARELLETMKHGGRPETGERFIEGRIRSRLEVECIETELMVKELVSRGIIAEHANRAAGFLERLSERLKSAGVDVKVIETVAGEIKAGIEAKMPLTFDQIKSRLVELGCGCYETVSWKA